MKLNFWKKKKKEITIEEEIENAFSVIKKLGGRKNISLAYFLFDGKENGRTYVNGDPREILDCIKNAYDSNPGFNKILNCIVQGISLEDLFIRNFSNSKSNIVDLPEGIKGIAVDGNNINNLSEEEIDRIIDELTKDDD